MSTNKNVEEILLQRRSLIEVKASVNQRSLVMYVNRAGPRRIGGLGGGVGFMRICKICIYAATASAGPTACLGFCRIYGA